MKPKMLVALACTSVLTAACGGRSDTVSMTPPVTVAVPAEASTSASAATQYVAELSALPADQTDTLEPVNPVPDSLATDDTAEPRLVE
jgi:hypothetical protein